MPLRATSYLDNTLEVLKGLLEYGYDVKLRRKTIGFGLHESDFDKEEIQGTRKIMRSRTDFFLKSKYVKEIVETDKRSKGYYSITPLGLAFLFQKTNINEENVFKRTIKYLQFFIEFYSRKQFMKREQSYDPILDFQLVNNQMKNTNNQLLFQTLTDVFNQISIKEKSDETEINLILMLNKNSFLISRKFIIKNNRIYNEDFDDTKKEIPDEKFNNDISLFVLLTFHHTLVRQFIKQNNRRMLGSYDINLLKEVDEFNVILYNKIFPNFDDFINIQENIKRRLTSVYDLV